MSNAFNPLNIGKTINKSFTAPFKYTPSIISKDLLVKGELVGDGILEVEGKILGNVDGGIVTIRESAFIEGDLIADTVNIRGCCEGLVRARIVNVFCNAKITGTVEYTSLSVEDGALIDGQLKRVAIKEKKIKGEVKEEVEE